VSEKVSIKVPAHLAVHVKPETSTAEKLKVVDGDLKATPLERATLLFFLCHDKNPEVKAAALAAMRGLPLDLLLVIVSSSSTHPRILDLIARLHAASAQLCFLLFEREDLLPATAEFLRLSSPAVRETVAENPQQPQNTAEVPEDEENKEEPIEDEEEFKSKYQLAQSMGVGEKIKMALTGDKEWRSILIKDSNKLVNGAVVKNPRITEPEVLTISKSVIQNDEILRVICHNKEWVKNYEIRKALVMNNKTPLPVALRFMSFLTEKDLAAMAKSKNISSVLCNNARRMLATKKKS